MPHIVYIEMIMIDGHDEADPFWLLSAAKKDNRATCLCTQAI